ncbi:glycoside hydrolase domain-containing protein [Pseudorhodobacter sp.]|uniref:glycoside hydrolase domain-containing protein n=1 Tax=Pseudorhodobacter sp. TaxID=1934400 RepID=UPI0026497D6D|nr:glycoside hydrolase domain-containing protein [Pseudorhodobacter sp.]MDN5787348.1 DUF1906 domain-containing protein [Pseudorhodobacter sp.]
MTICLSLCLFLLAGLASAQTRPAIIDTSVDTRPYLRSLSGSGVQVVARYLARCKQPIAGLESKRLIDQGPRSDPQSEVSQLLANRFAILSVYQFYNGSTAKLFGKVGDASLPDTNCNAAPPGGRSADAEAALDAAAAISQARTLGQPQGSAIYFGMDFEYDPTSDGGEIERRIIAYFTEINRQLRAAGYRVGAYGNGYVLNMLLGRKLAEFAWISASASFHETSKFYSSGKWTLFQHEVDTEWFGEPAGNGCSRGLILDADVQNPLGADSYAGFWNAQGKFSINPVFNEVIANDRRFVCNGNAVVLRSETSKSTDVTDARACKTGKAVVIPPVAGYSYAVAIGEQAGKMVAVDVDDDGSFDGWTEIANLTEDFRSKPEWIGATAKRKAAKCN